MSYRVILVRNGEYVSTLHRCRTKETAFINFHKIKENNKIIYPKKFISTNGIKPVKYEIYITKVTEENDTFRMLKDAYGKTYQEKSIGDWTILHSDDYDIEETFWIYGLDPKINRPTIKEVVNRLMVGAWAKKMVKQIIVVHNKLIIYNDESFEMIICKCLEDAQRLHHTLAKIAKKQKIKSLMFVGTATPASVSRIYQLIHEKTGWPLTKIRRTTTRP